MKTPPQALTLCGKPSKNLTPARWHFLKSAAHTSAPKESIHPISSPQSLSGKGELLPNRLSHLPSPSSRDQGLPAPEFPPGGTGLRPSATNAWAPRYPTAPGQLEAFPRALLEKSPLPASLLASRVPPSNRQPYLGAGEPEERMPTGKHHPHLHRNAEGSLFSFLVCFFICPTLLGKLD